MQRFHDLDGGRILIDGQDIAQVTQESLRRAISFVPQDISLLHRSILDNIRYGRPEASDREVVAAAEAARCRDFIEALPAGFSTIVGDRGTRLSGGQRQRIAIARALLKDSPIVLLDEATSSLDGESEELIRQALDRLMREPHGDRHRPPPFDPAQLRPHRRAGAWPDGAGRPARGADAPRRPLPLP